MLSVGVSGVSRCQWYQLWQYVSAVSVCVGGISMFSGVSRC